VGALVKIALAYIFITLGLRVQGAFWALVVSYAVPLLIFSVPLRQFLFARVKKETIPYKEVTAYLFPVALNSFCLMALVNMDMIFVKRLFSTDSASMYALSQMVGKIFLFLPGAIAIVLLPHASGLNAKGLDATDALKKSLLLTALLCAGAIVVYNVQPALVLRVLTGKVYPEAILIGRLFSLSMSVYALILLMCTYFLSIRDLRYLVYLSISTIVQFAALLFARTGLVQVQLVLCANACLLFFICLRHAFREKEL